MSKERYKLSNFTGKTLKYQAFKRLQKSPSKSNLTKCTGINSKIGVKSFDFMQSNICKQSRPGSMIISLHESLTGQQEKKLEFRIFQKEATTRR